MNHLAYILKEKLKDIETEEEFERIYRSATKEEREAFDRSLRKLIGKDIDELLTKYDNQEKST